MRALAQRCRDLLGHREVHVGRVGHALQRGELGAFVEVLAFVHVGDAHQRAEWRADGLARDHGLGARNLRGGNVELRAGAIEFLLGGGLALDHALHARELRFRELALCFERLQLRGFHGDVEADEHRAFFDDGARGEARVAHGAG